MPKPYLTAKYQKKLMNGHLDNARHTYVHTRVNFKVCLSARPKLVTSNEPASRGVWLMRGLLLEEYILILQFI